MAWSILLAQENWGFMERQLLERMIGAGVLLVALVVIVPAILDGRPDADQQTQTRVSEPANAAPEAPLRQHTIRLDQRPDTPPVARQAPSAPSARAPQDAAGADEGAKTPNADARSASASKPKPKPSPSPSQSPNRRALWPRRRNRNPSRWRLPRRRAPRRFRPDGWFNSAVFPAGRMRRASLTRPAQRDFRLT